MKIDLLSVNDRNGLQNVYILLNSVKQTKQQTTDVTYHLIIEGLDQTVKDYFADLQSDDFKLDFIQLEPFKQKINLPTSGAWVKVNYYTMVRCLCPSYFTEVEKMLYVDTDIVFFQQGIEDFWNTDLTDYYVAGTEDVIIQYQPAAEPQRANLKHPKQYLNCGILLFNYKLIRAEGKDKEFQKWCLNWNYNELKPLWLDQSLINFVLGSKMKYVDYKFDDFSLVTTIMDFEIHKKYLKQKYGYEQPVNSIGDAVVLHFTGNCKPWKDLSKYSTKLFPYLPVAQKVWEHLEWNLKKYAKVEET